VIETKKKVSGVGVQVPDDRGQTTDGKNWKIKQAI